MLSCLLSGAARYVSCVRVPWFRAELLELYKSFVKNYPIISIEDPFDQDDTESVSAFTAEGICQVPFSPLAIMCVSVSVALLQHAARCAKP